MTYPKLFRLRQEFEGPQVQDVAAEVHGQLSRLALTEKIKPGERVAITAGSRGIANIDQIIKATVDFVKGLTAEPFLVASMGSHGGATAEGQLEVLRTYGITEQACQCPILSSMDTVVVCQSREGFDVHFDRNAFEADHVIVCGRVKAHTDFNGAIQSGLMKMMLIGLGKQRGASIYHRAFSDFSFDQIVRSVSSTVIENCRVVAGLAIVENGYEQTALIEAVAPQDIQTRESELLRMSEKWMARLPFDAADVLIVDEIGKNISGTGMDTNVVGRKTNENAALADETPKIKKIVVRGLTAQTHGNATGIGIADFATQNVIDDMDYEATQVNCVTSGRTAVGMLPLYFANDQRTIDAALMTVGLVRPEKARVIRIRNTLHLDEVACSEAYLDEARARSDLQVAGPPYEMSFSADGRLIS